MDASSAGDREGVIASALVEAATDAVALVDPGGHLVQVNDRFAELHGGRAADLEDAGLEDAFTPDAARRLTDRILPDLAPGESWEGTLAARRADGARLETEATVTSLPDGRALLVVRGRAGEGADAESVARLDMLVRHAPVVLFELAPDGTFTLSRGRALSTLGLEPGEVVGRTVFDVYEDHEGILDAARRALGGETLSTQHEVDGRVFETRMTPVVDGDGAVQRVIGVATDVTERRASEELFRGVFESSNDPIILHDVHGWIEQVNNRVLEMLGYEREDVVGENVLDLQPGDAMEPGQEALEEVLSEGSAQVETVFETADGGRIPVEVSARRFEVGDREMVQGIARDVSERKRVEQRLRGLVRELEASESELRSLLNAMPDLVLLLDDEGRHVEAPRGNLELFPGDPDEVVGRRLDEVLPETIAERLHDAVEQALLEDELVRVEYSLPIDDEARFLEGRLVSVPGNRVLLLARDITDLKRAREEIQAAQEQFELAVGDLSRSLGAARGTQEIAERLARGAHSIIGARAAVVLDPGGVLATAVAPRVEHDEVEARVREHPDEFSWFSASLEDSDRPIDLLVLPREDQALEDADRQKLEIISTQAAIAFHRAEVTDRVRKAHDRLERSARQKQMFLDVLSHDLKNPLAVALGRVELLEKRHPEMADELGTVEASLARADRLIDRSLLFSRLEEQEGLSRSREDLRDLAERVVDNLEGAIDRADVDVAVEGANEAPVQAHPILEQAVENLVGNALKWSPRGGTVEIVLETNDEHARLRVVDHGQGIPPAERDKLFERFTRVDETGTKGTGLGLAIADRVVDMHEGRLWHEETPGGGATFALELELTA